MHRRDLLTGAPVALSGLMLASLTSGRAGASSPTTDTDPRPPLLEVHAGDREVGAPFGTRSPVYGGSGAAASAHPFATCAGIEILKAGGSAVDAAIAMNACLGFLEPVSCGIGGDLCAMVWAPGSGLSGTIGAGRSPRGLTLETARAHARNGTLPPYGAITVSVPGAVDAWWELHRRFGRLPWKVLFEPAIRQAETGVPMPPVIAAELRRAVERLGRPGMNVEELANIRATFAPSGRTPEVGEIFRNPDLAKTYRTIAQGGRDVFYLGEIARVIDRYMRRIGGWLRYEDLATHRSEWNRPVSTSYRGVEVHALTGNTQGIATLQMLNIIEQFDLRAAGFQSPLSLHIQAEAKRLAFVDRARLYADPDFARVPVEHLISKDYAKARARLIRSDRVIDLPPDSAPSNKDTTYFAAADSRGMMVSMIQSNFRNVGSGLVPDRLGFGLHGRGQLFSLRDGHPNIYAPGKRPFQTIIPGFATAKGRPWVSYGMAGGDFQPQGQAQMMINRIDYDLDVQAAGDAPRWHHQGSPETMGEYDKSGGNIELLRLERGVPESTARALAAMGWRIGASDGSFGNYQAVELLQRPGDRVYAAGSDMRLDGAALAC